MGIIFKLVLRDFTRHRSMLFFAFLSIVAVSCLVVWFVAGIDTDSFAEDNGKTSYFGNCTLAISSQRPISAETLDAIYLQNGITQTVNAFQFPADLRLENFKEGLTPSGMGDRKSPMLLGMSAKTSPFELDDGRWFNETMECVVSTQAAKLLTLSKKDIVPGDKISVKTKNGTYTLTVTGTVEQNEVKASRSGVQGTSGNPTFSFGFGIGLGGGKMGGGTQKQPPATAKGQADKTPQKTSSGSFGAMRIGPVTPSVYISLADASKIASDNSSVNIVYIRLSDAGKIKEYYKDLEETLGMPLAKAKLETNDTLPPEKAENETRNFSPETVISQAWSTIGIVIIASVFIIFTTLSMGVSEKIRFLAMLRTCGFTKAQVAFYIIAEGVCLGLLGWMAGLAAGWALLTLLIYLQTGTIPLVSLTFPCVAFAFACSLFGAIIASIVPAWRATGIPPAESMARRVRNLSTRKLVIFGIAGLSLLASIPVIVLGIPMSVGAKVTVFSTLGTLFLGAGFMLFFPWTIVMTEKIFAPGISFLLGFNRRFMTNILSSNQWRTLGTTIAVSIGLGLFCSIHIWSNSMLTMFTVPDTIPNWLVRFQEGVISDTTTKGVAEMKGVRNDRFMRLSVAQPDLDTETQAKMKAASAMGSNVVVFGIEPEKAWRSKDPMLELDFVEGSRSKALEEFSKPGARVCVIPETLSVHANLHVGDTLRLAKSTVRPRERRAPPGSAIAAQTEKKDAHEIEYAEYKVAGVVDFAWVWLTKCSGVRVSAGRTAAAVFTPGAPLKEDFGSPENEFFWFDTDPEIEYAELDDYMKGLAERSSELHPEAAARTSFSGGTRWDSGINRNFVQVSSVESLNNSLNSRATGVIDTMTKMPLIILILSTIAVINTMVVSVRSRRWEMGVMRACGVTRGGLVRMIVAEALLIGICACVMSFSFGLYYSWLATRMVEYAPMFGIIAPKLAIPWAKLIYGFALTLIVCLAAAVYPAVSTGMRDTSSLLQRKD